MSVIIIVDLSQVMLSNIMMQIGNHTNAVIEESMVRHMVLNSLRLLKLKFSAEYGELVIACDSKNYWRRKIFPYYKANRKKSQAASELDWKAICECLNKIREEIKVHFPYRVIDIETAEADDVIGTLCMHYGAQEDDWSFMNLNNQEKILILSADKDFQQLQLFTNVEQYDPIRKRFLKCEDPKKFLQEHVLKGDTGDGIPNVLSSDDCFVVGRRQTPLRQKKMEQLIDGELVEGSEYFRNYLRNRELIDLQMIPRELQDKILSSFEAQRGKKPDHLFDYFIAHKLKNLTESIGDFV